MKRNKFVAFLLCVFVSVAGFAVTGCGSSVPDTEDTLEIYVLDAGYGVQWCYDIIDLFKEQDWVKEKYPKLKIYPRTSDVETFASSQLSAGKKVNTYDLMFATNIWDYCGKNGQCLDLTEVLYDSVVPGESVTYKQKMNDSYLISNRYNDGMLGDAEKYYTTSWAGGMSGIIYNASFFEEFGYAVPNTTDELIALCATYKNNKAKNGYSFIQSKDAYYWDYLMPVWWAQYEGTDCYIDFWNGIANDTYSTAIFDQKGREYALGVYETLLKYDKGYVNPQSFTQEFMTAQTSFLQGEALMHVNGDWFSSEMKTIIASLESRGDKLSTFKSMRLPIISALGGKLGITDKELSAAVAYVDAVGNGETPVEPTFASTKGYSTQKIIDDVRAARGIVHSVGANHSAVIPAYATAKAVAVDFLRFMATDVALDAYTAATDGATLPFDHNVSEELYAKLASAQKTRIDYFQSGLEIYTLPIDGSFPLARYGGLDAFVTKKYYATFSAHGNTKTPAQYMSETESAWTQKKFADALNAAGIVA